jgi:hypothetical protein
MYVNKVGITDIEKRRIVQGSFFKFSQVIPKVS